MELYLVNSSVRRYNQNVRQVLQSGVVLSTMRMGVECWPIKNSHIQMTKVIDMRMLKWICEHTRRDKLEIKINKTRWERLYDGSDKLKKARLTWFEHVKTRCTKGLVRRCWKLTMVDLRSGRARSKKYCDGVIKLDTISF